MRILGCSASLGMLIFTSAIRFTGRERTRSAVLERYHELLDIPPTSVVNEYGMTELCSQMYDTTLADRIAGAPGTRRIPLDRAHGRTCFRKSAMKPGSPEPTCRIVKARKSHGWATARLQRRIATSIRSDPARV